MRKAELRAAIGKRVDVLKWPTNSGGAPPEHYTGTLLEVGDDGWNKVDVSESYRDDGQTRIKYFKSVSIKRVLAEAGKQ